MSEISTLISKDVSPHSIVSELQKSLPDMSEIYVVIRDKKGTFFEMTCGDVSGCLFAAFLLERVCHKWHSDDV